MAKSKLDESKQNNKLGFSQEDWASAYFNVEEELSNIEIKTIRGEVPKELIGTFYRNGPGRLERAGQWVHHPFDGDGMIASIQFNQGKAKFTNRFIRTNEWEKEEKAGKFIFRGVFGTQKKGGPLFNAFDMRLKNIANTNVVQLGNRLLALWEASSPYALDPKSLQTYGLSDLNGVLKKGEAFSAHPRFDPGHHENERMVSFGVTTGPKSTIRLMEFEKKGNNAGQLISDRKDNFEGFAFLHDFAITPNWALFLQNAISFNPIPFILGQKGAAQCLKSKPNGQAKFWIIPRDCGKFAGQKALILNAPNGFVFHHLNAFEIDNKIIIDSIYYKDFPSIGPNEDFRHINFDEIPEGKLKRCSINLAKESYEIKEVSSQCCEFAMVNPKFQGLCARYAWMASAECKQGNGPLQAIKKIDFVTGEELVWSAAPRGFVGEPVMIPHQNSSKEDEGWILTLIWNSKRLSTDLIILNSDDLSMQATLELPIGMPHGLHGSWVNSI